MARRSIVSVNLDNLGKLPEKCRSCAYWESTSKVEVNNVFEEGNLTKEHWYNIVLTEWGSCGKLLLQGGEVLGYSQYAPSSFFPQLEFIPLGSVSSDAIYLSCLYIPLSLRDRGLGKVLLNSIQKDLLRRGYRAIETFARRAPAQNPSGWIEFYLKNGFQIIREAGLLALMRLDLKSILALQENLEVVLESLSIPLPTKIKVPIPS